MDPKTTPENATAAPGSIELGGRTFLVAQHTPADVMALRKRLKKHVKDPLSMYADLVSDPKFRRLPKKVRDTLAEEAGRLRMQGDVSLTADMAEDMLQEPRHCAFLAWLLIRKLHPDVTLEALADLITDDNAAAVYADLARESGMSEMGN